MAKKNSVGKLRWVSCVLVDLGWILCYKKNPLFFKTWDRTGKKKQKHHPLRRILLQVGELCSMFGSGWRFTWKYGGDVIQFRGFDFSTWLGQPAIDRICLDPVSCLGGYFNS